MNQIRHLLVIACLLIGTTFMYGQSDCDKNSAVICEDFEDYDATMPLGPQSDIWTTWSGNEGGAEDGNVSTEYSNSGSQSMQIIGTVPGGGAQDVILELGDETSGRYRVRFDIYIPGGKGAYYNIQHDFDGPGQIYSWAHQIIFDPTGLAQLDAGNGADAVVFYNHDEWFQVDQIIDMNADTASISVAGKYMHSWKFTNEATSPGTGMNKMSAMDFFPLDVTNEFYIDDLFVELLPDCSLDPGAIICDDMEAYDPAEAIGPQSSFWSTWSINDGSGEDANVSTNYAASGTQSMLIGNDGAQDVILQLGNRVNGAYRMQFMMYVPAGADGYFNIHSEEVFVSGQSDWIGEFYFGTDGTSDTEGMGESSIDGSTFAHPHDAWFMVRADMDIDLNTLSFWVDGVMVHDAVPIDDLTLGMLDFFSATGTMEMYIDNVLFKQLSPSELDCANSSLGTASGPNAVCWGETVTIEMGPSVIPNYNNLDTLSGFAWAISSADISGSAAPFTEPSFLGVSVGFFPPEVYDLSYVNDGSVFPAGIFYMTPVSFGYAINTDGTLAGFDFSGGCVTTGNSVEVTFLEELDPIDVSIDATGSTGSDGTATVTASGGAGTYEYEWSNGETTAEITGLAPGDYTVTVTSTDNSGCSPDPAIITVTVEALISVNDIDILNSLTVAPNPTRGNVYIDMDLSQTATVTLDITDVTGKVVAQFTPQNTSSYQTSIDLSHLSNGLYFARITVDGDSVVKKIQLSK